MEENVAKMEKLFQKNQGDLKKEIESKLDNTKNVLKNLYQIILTRCPALPYSLSKEYKRKDGTNFHKRKWDLSSYLGMMQYEKDKKNQTTDFIEDRSEKVKKIRDKRDVNKAQQFNNANEHLKTYSSKILNQVLVNDTSIIYKATDASVAMTAIGTLEKHLKEKIDQDSDLHGTESTVHLTSLYQTLINHLAGILDYRKTFALLSCLL